MSESTTVMVPELMPAFGSVHLAAAGYLARYTGRTREAYTLDLTTFFAWCAARGTEVSAMTRPHLETYVRWMQRTVAMPPRPSPAGSPPWRGSTALRSSTAVWTVARGVCAPPHVPEESQVLGLDRMQLGA
jgi:hypothetical protein